MVLALRGAAARADPRPTAAVALRAGSTTAIAELRQLVHGGDAGAAGRAGARRGRPRTSSTGCRSAPASTSASTDGTLPAALESTGVLRRRRGARQRPQALRRDDAGGPAAAPDGRAASSRSTTTASAGARPGAGLRGLADRVDVLGGRLVVDSPAGVRHAAAGGAAVRVVIGEDEALLREGLAAAARRGRLRRSSPPPPTPPGSSRRAAQHEPDLVHHRHPHAARQHRRRAAGGAADPRGAAGDRDRSCSPSTFSAATRSNCSATQPRGVGYLLKQRIADITTFRRRRAPGRRGRHRARPRGRRADGGPRGPRRRPRSPLASARSSR